MLSFWNNVFENGSNLVFPKHILHINVNLILIHLTITIPISLISIRLSILSANLNHPDSILDFTGSRVKTLMKGFQHIETVVHEDRIKHQVDRHLWLVTVEDQLSVEDIPYFKFHFPSSLVKVPCCDYSDIVFAVN